MITDRRGVLYVVGTPIGNLEDITLRALRILKSVSLIAAEDTRVTARLLARHVIDTKCISFREQNAKRAILQILEQLETGASVALVSDAGTPSISDPGEQLVAAAAAANIVVSPIPGPSALAAAMSTAALPGDGVRFIGFLPRSGKDRKRRLRSTAMDPSCTVIYESPHRLGNTLVDLASVCGAARSAVVFRELTKLHEELARGTLKELADRFANNVKGEITIVIAGAKTIDAEDISNEMLSELVANEIKRGRSAKDTAASLSLSLGIPKKKVYTVAVEIIGRNRDSQS